MKKLGYLLYLYIAAAVLTVLSLVFAQNTVLSVVLLSLGAVAVTVGVVIHFIRKKQEGKLTFSWGACMVLLGVTALLCAVASVLSVLGGV